MKTYHYLLLFLAASLIVVIIFLQQKPGGFGGGEHAFAIRDTAKVNRIMLNADVSEEIVLSRTEKGWVMNDSLAVSPVAIDNFLFVMSRIRIKGIADDDFPVERAGGIKISIFEGRKDHVFLYHFIDKVELIQREGSTNFYPFEISGFPDYSLAQVAIADPFYWRDRLVCSLRPEEIAIIEVQYPASPDKDFTIFQSGSKTELYDPLSGVIIPEEITRKDNLRMYISYFVDVYYDEILKDRVKSDSVLSQSPDIQISIEDISGKTSRLGIWPVIQDGRRDERISYLRLDDDQELLITRQTIIDLWRKEREDFLLHLKR